MKFTTKECNSIIDYAKGNVLKHITNYADELKYLSVDYNYSGFILEKETKWVFERLVNYLTPIFPNVQSHLITTINVHQFPKGGRFVKHIDIEREEDFYYIIGATISENFTGGKLLAYEPDEELASSVGELYGMWATRPHEVTEILSGNRWSMVCFLNRNQLGINKSII